MSKRNTSSTEKRPGIMVTMRRDMLEKKFGELFDLKQMKKLSIELGLIDDVPELRKKIDERIETVYQSIDFILGPFGRDTTA